MADGNVQEFDIPPGFYRQSSIAGARGRYVGGDKVRFRSGKPEKMKGFVRRVSTALDGLVRGMLTWTSTSQVDYIAAGTVDRAYAIIDSLKDITPLAGSGTEANNPFTTTNGSSSVKVTHTANGVAVGANVTWSGAATFNNVTMNGTFTVVSVIDVNNFTVTALTVANANGTGGGAAVTYQYAINPGLASSAVGLGYGVGPYGSSTYGTTRTAGGVTLDLRTWFFDAYGSTNVILIVQPSGGGIYFWDEHVSANQAVPLTNAPTACRASFITNERMVVALGTTTAMTMQWSDDNDITIWTPALSNTANIRTLQEGAKLVAGSRFNDVNLVWSDSAIYLMQFDGSSDSIYSTLPVGKGCGLCGATAFEILPDMVIWFTNRLDVFVYAGGLVQIAPNWEDIRNYIIADINTAFLDKMTVGQSPNADEVMFHYVSINSPNNEPDKYFAVKKQDWQWYFGTRWLDVGRTAHKYFRRSGGAVVMAGTDGFLYQHETGVDGVNGSNVATAIPASLQTGPVAIDRNRDTDFNNYIPDWERIAGAVTLQVQTQNWPMSPTFLDDRSFQITATTDKVDINMGGRYARMTISVAGLGADFRIGIPLIDIAPAGSTR